MLLTQILQKIRAAFYTKAETNNLLSGKSNTNHNHNSAYLGIKAKAESAKSADSVAWTNVSGRPTKVSQFTNDSGYITSSGSCNYANSAGSAPANGGTSTASAYLNDYGTLQYGVNRLQYFNISTSTTSGAGNIANPTDDWYYHIIQSHANGDGYYFDIASHFHGNNVYYRRIAGGSESGWIQFIDSGNIGSQSVNYANLAGSVAWSGISNKPRTYPPSSHTHDDRYYTESEVNNLLGGKANDSDVVHKNGNETINGLKTFTSETFNTSPHAFRHIYGEYGTFWRNDGTNLYLMLTNSGDQYGAWNNFRPLTVNLATGICSINGTAGGVAWSGISNKPNTYPPSSHTHDGRYYTETEVNNLLGGKANTSGTYSGLNAGSATNATYTNWLRTSSHSDHLFHTEWDGSSSFWTYVTAGDGSYRAVRVERANSASVADYASRSTNNGAFYISGYQIYVG